MMMFFAIMPLPVQWCILPVSARRRPVGFAASTQSIYIGTDNLQVVNLHPKLSRASGLTYV
jgi:hypothetical protein